MARHSANRGILVLESPWELDDGDSNRSSVVPFIEGVAKLAGDTEVYHANFYDKKSFEYALECLCKVRFSNTIVYIAAHGYKQKIGNMKLEDILFAIGMKSKQYNITGVMFGSCFVGGNTELIEVFTTSNNLRWCAGYASTSNWLSGTFIDSAIIAQMINLEESDFSNRDTLVEHLAYAISPFSDQMYIGDDYKENPVALSDSLQFIVQPKGKGYHPKTVSSEVFTAKKQYDV